MAVIVDHPTGMLADDLNPMLERLEEYAVALEFLHEQPASERRDLMIARVQQVQLRLLTRLRSSGDFRCAS